MATIRAKISSDSFAPCKIEISGDGMVQKITCADVYAERLIKESIQNGDWWIANAYYPLPNTMLQAYATVWHYAKESDIEVVGDIGEIPMEPGVVY